MHGHITQQDNNEEAHIHDNETCTFSQAPYPFLYDQVTEGKIQKGSCNLIISLGGSPLQTFAEPLDTLPTYLQACFMVSVIMPLR